MDRIERIGPRARQWLLPALDPDREDVAARRRAEDERRRRQRRPPEADPPPGTDPDEPPHRIDVRA